MANENRPRDLPTERRRPLRVAVVDDSWHVRTSVQTVLMAHPSQLQVVMETPHVEDVLALEAPVDVVLLDVWLGDDDELSIDCIPALRATGARVLIHTQERAPAKLLDAIDLGASGVALKYEGDPEFLVEAILTIGRGEQWVRSPMANALLDDSRCARLTHRQKEILTLVADGLSYSDAAGALFVSPETIKKTLADVTRRYRELGRPARRNQAVAEAVRDGHIRLRRAPPEVSP